MNSFGLNMALILMAFIMNLHSNRVVVSIIYRCCALFGHNENLKQLEVDPKKGFSMKAAQASMTVTATGLYATRNPAKPQLDRQALSIIIANGSP